MMGCVVQADDEEDLFSVNIPSPEGSIQILFELHRKTPKVTLTQCTADEEVEGTELEFPEVLEYLRANHGQKVGTIIATCKRKKEKKA